MGSSKSIERAADKNIKPYLSRLKIRILNSIYLDVDDLAWSKGGRKQRGIRNQKEGKKKIRLETEKGFSDQKETAILMIRDQV